MTFMEKIRLFLLIKCNNYLQQFFRSCTERTRNCQKNIGHDERRARNGTGTEQERKNYCIFLFSTLSNIYGYKGLQYVMGRI